MEITPSPVPPPLAPTETTSPTTSVAGGPTFAAATRVGSSARDPVIVRWSSVHAHCTIAAGVEGGRPASINVRQVSASFPEAISTTKVSVAVAMRARSTVSSAWAVDAVTTANERARPRCVSGIPAAAGAATALVTPGTMSTGTPASAHAISSSPPRPNTNGSPPFSRTTSRPAEASRTSKAPISCWLIAWRPGSFPTYTRSARGARSSSAGATSRS